MQNVFPLSSLKSNQHALIHCLKGEEAMRERLENLGFTTHTPITCLYEAAFGDPKAYRIRNTVIALRQKDAEQIICKATGECL